MRHNVTPSQWTNSYDAYFTANKRDAMRAEEAEKAGIVDGTFFAGSFDSEAYHSHFVMTRALRNLQRTEYEANKTEIHRRLDEQVSSRRNRIEGFLRAANINVSNERKTLVFENETEEPVIEEPKAPATEETTEAAGEEAEEEEVPVKKQFKKKMKRFMRDDDKQDTVDSAYEFDSAFDNNTDMNNFLQNRITINSLVRPNFNSWMSVLLTRTYAPDEIVQKQIPYSTRDASSVHKLLDLAIDLQNPYLLVIAEKCCGLYAEFLPLQLRQKYKHFKEEVLVRNSGTLTLKQTWLPSTAEQLR